MPTRRALSRTLSAFLAGLLLLFAATAFAARQSARLIESVEVRDNCRLAAEEILRHVKSRPGEPYDEAQAHRDLQALANLDLFDMRETRLVVQTGRRGGVELVFEIKELPLIAEVRFEGLRGLDESEVLEALRGKKIGVAAGAVYRPDEVLKATRVLRDLLSARGQTGLAVEARAEPSSSTSVKLVFVVSAQKLARY